MLLVGQLANRVVRQTPEEAQSTLALPIAILQHSLPSVQINVRSHIIISATIAHNRH
jgi:U3 small nucleolar RNA-associated protein 10